MFQFLTKREISILQCLCGCVCAILAAFVTYATFQVRGNIIVALKSNPDISQMQRTRLEMYYKKSSRLLAMTEFSIFLSMAAFFLFGSSWDLARRNTWIFYILMFIGNGVWALRHVFNSIKVSYLMKAREHMTSSYPEADIEPAGDDHEEGNEFGNGSIRPLRNVSPFNSNRKTRRKVPKGIKRKPLEIMTAVTERTAEGTVEFTQVDGLDPSISNIRKSMESCPEESELVSTRIVE
jgi:hypothetical protein